MSKPALISYLGKCGRVCYVVDVSGRKSFGSKDSVLIIGSMEDTSIGALVHNASVQDSAAYTPQSLELHELNLVIGAVGCR